jgi:NAD(P)H-dependent FMN reductase
MPHIAIISASVRVGRVSHRVALYFKNYISENNLATVEILDLKEFNFPMFDERLNHQKNPIPAAVDFSEKIKKADGVIIVTPEYNGGYPGSLKNAIDLLYPEWHRKPIAVSTVSDGVFGGTQVITSLAFSLFKIKAWLVPAMCPMPKAKELFDEQGNPTDKQTLEKRVVPFIKELLWCVEARQKMEKHDG